MASRRIDEWLPEGWKVEVRVRKTGKRDRYYIDPKTGYVFRSLIAIDRYLLSGEIRKRVHRKKDKTKSKTAAGATAESSSNNAAKKTVEPDDHTTQKGASKRKKPSQPSSEPKKKTETETEMTTTTATTNQTTTTTTTTPNNRPMTRSRVLGDLKRMWEKAAARKKMRTRKPVAEKTEEGGDSRKKMRTCKPAAKKTEEGGTCKPVAEKREEGGDSRKKKRTCKPAAEKTEVEGTCKPAEEKTEEGGTCKPAAEKTEEEGTCKPAEEKTEEGGDSRKKMRTCKPPAEKTEEGGDSKKTEEAAAAAAPEIKKRRRLPQPRTKSKSVEQAAAKEKKLSAAELLAYKLKKSCLIDDKQEGTTAAAAAANGSRRRVKIADKQKVAGAASGSRRRVKIADKQQDGAAATASGGARRQVKDGRKSNDMSRNRNRSRNSISRRKKTAESLSSKIKKEQQPTPFFIQEPDDDNLLEASSDIDIADIEEIIESLNNGENDKEDNNVYISATELAVLLAEKMKQQEDERPHFDHPDPDHHHDFILSEGCYRPEIPRTPPQGSGAFKPTTKCEENNLIFPTNTTDDGNYSPFCDDELNFPFGYLCSDPCFEFAFKTLTGSVNNPSLADDDFSCHRKVEDYPATNLTRLSQEAVKVEKSIDRR